MPGLLPDVDPDGLLEYSVVYTDRALNHMSRSFQGVMNDISSSLKDVYGAQAAVVVPGSGTYGMEAVARQFATDQPCLVIRNGWFSYRWTQIFEAGNIPSSEIVLKASPVGSEPQAPFAPAPIDVVVETIRRERPGVVFAPHVETSAGMMLPDEYLRSVADAVHDVGGLFVLDCIASGTVWVDMSRTGVDVLVSAPQKGWSGTPCCGLVMLGDGALARMEETTSTSFACDLKKWHQIMLAYENGGHAYHATMPTDGLRAFGRVMSETREVGFDAVKKAQLELGRRVREALERDGFPSVAAEGFQAPGVVVSYTQDPEIASGRKFAEAGLQIAAGVPLRCDEPDDFRTFRIGLFGLDKLKDVDGTVRTFEHALDLMRAPQPTQRSAAT
ncbi:MAG: alanine--glyoxylate aminotransferase family protein [Gemmatimonadetes bacterium]|nr:alanine--glyoxylate aminotransferase family protein [Gemmatimonadota bacterium]